MSGLREKIAQAICSNWAGGRDAKDWGGLTETSRANARSDADAALATFRQWMEENGLVCVPREPTEQMQRDGMTVRGIQDNQGYKNTAEIYEVMIAAAPDPFGDGP